MYAKTSCEVCEKIFNCVAMNDNALKSINNIITVYIKHKQTTDRDLQ